MKATQSLSTVTGSAIEAVEKSRTALVKKGFNVPSVDLLHDTRPFPETFPVSWRVPGSDGKRHAVVADIPVNRVITKDDIPKEWIDNGFEFTGWTPILVALTITGANSSIVCGRRFADFNSKTRQFYRKLNEAVSGQASVRLKYLSEQAAVKFTRARLSVKVSKTGIETFQATGSTTRTRKASKADILTQTVAVLEVKLAKALAMLENVPIAEIES